ncbi:hypothetical protein C8R43DRAFT_1204588 [Mycena crocata]|nr:hypothetical protein C8R43DRAFT_1204588 [Mycena crocata]
MRCWSAPSFSFLTLLLLTLLAPLPLGPPVLVLITDHLAEEAYARPGGPPFLPFPIPFPLQISLLSPTRTSTIATRGGKRAAAQAGTHTHTDPKPLAINAIHGQRQYFASDCDVQYVSSSLGLTKGSAVHGSGGRLPSLGEPPASNCSCRVPLYCSRQERNPRPAPPEYSIKTATGSGWRHLFRSRLRPMRSCINAGKDTVYS